MGFVGMLTLGEAKVGAGHAEGGRGRRRVGGERARKGREERGIDDDGNAQVTLNVLSLSLSLALSSHSLSTAQP
jgi:hypothetical protein